MGNERQATGDGEEVSGSGGEKALRAHDNAKEVTARGFASMTLLSRTFHSMHNVGQSTVKSTHSIDLLAEIRLAPQSPPTQEGTCSLGVMFNCLPSSRS